VPQPFFTIGVPTYNRRELLKQTLDSILSQTFSDFEIIIGNDYTAEILSCDMLGITDPRIRIINHPRNLREVGNMNALLEAANGRYFTWLFDDDLLEPDYLATAHNSLEHSGFPPAFFSSFRIIRGNEPFHPQTYAEGSFRELTGRDLLGIYDILTPSIISTSGLFDTVLLRSIVGGVEELCLSPTGIYCEYLFLVRSALLEKIVFADTPLVVFRVHAESWGEGNTEPEKYQEAGTELLHRCAAVLKHPQLIADFSANLMKICKIHMITFATRAALFEISSEKSGPGAAKRALTRFFAEARKTRNLYCQLGGLANLRTGFEFIQFQIYCCRLILFRLRQFWWQRFQ
jgi:glycosyltransferase involved in cell wall biosynthesis